jgi:hypothetical protein
VGYLTVYAYGEQSTGDVIPHYNGSHWEMSGSGSILYRCIWGSSAADVYVVGKQDGTNCGEWSHFVGSSSSIQDSLRPPYGCLGQFRHRCLRRGG